MSQNGIGIDQEKIWGVVEWETPCTCKQMKSFLGFINVYHPFIPNFASVTLPLMDLFKNKGKGVQTKLPSASLSWSPACEEAFSKLKTLFSSEPSLAHQVEFQQLIVRVDASNVAMGAVLLQKVEDNQLHPCTYSPKCFLKWRGIGQFGRKKLNNSGGQFFPQVLLHSPPPTKEN